MGVHDMDRYSEVKALLGIPEDEPIFILRAQDKYAPVAVEDYVQTVYRHEREINPSRNLREWREKGNAHAGTFYDWQEDHPDSTKSPD